MLCTFVLDLCDFHAVKRNTMRLGTIKITLYNIHIYGCRENVLSYDTIEHVCEFIMPVLIIYHSTTVCVYINSNDFSPQTYYDIITRAFHKRCRGGMTHLYYIENTLDVLLPRGGLLCVAGRSESIFAYPSETFGKHQTFGCACWTESI